MAECTVCGSTFPDTARYCANCGNALRDVTRPSAFEVGRIAALDTMKSEIFKWLALPAAIVTVIAGIGGYLGVTNIITTEVQTHVRNEVEREMNKNFAHVRDEMQTKLLEVAHDQGAIQTQLADLEKNKTQLQNSIKSATTKEKLLRDTIDKMKLGPLMTKLQFDFDHVREFGLLTSIELDPPIDHDFMNFQHAEYVTLLGEGEVPLARLERSVASAVEDTKGINGVNIQFALQAEPYKILNQKIGMLSNLIGARLVFYSDPQYRDKLELYTNSVKSIHLSVLINSRRLWQTDLSKPDLKMAESFEGSKVLFSSNVQLETYGDSDTLMHKYEDLFKDKESQ